MGLQEVKPALPLWLALSPAVRFWMHHCPRPQLQASTYPSEKGDKHFAFGKVWELSETEGLQQWRQTSGRRLPLDKTPTVSKVIPHL